MEPVEYARLLRRRWRVVAACVLVAATAAWLTTPAHPVDPVVDWQATHTLVRDPEAGGGTALAIVGLFATTGEVPRLVAEEIGFDGEPAVLARRIEAVPDETLSTLAITATASSREAAAELANLWAAQTLAHLAGQQQSGSGDALAAAQRRVEELRADIDALGDQIEAVEEGEAEGDPALLEAERDAKLRQFGTAFDEVEQLEDAPPPRTGYITLEPAIPELAEATGAGFGAPKSRPVRSLIGGALGLVLGVALILVLERVDPRLRTRSATEEAFELPVLAAVPPLGRKERTGLIAAESPGSVAAEAYRSIRSGVQLMGLHVLIEPSVPGGRVERAAGHATANDHQVILVTSPAPGEGKSTTAANLAVVFAETGASVLVLGCDFRRPEVHKFFDVSASVGLSDVLAGGGSSPSLVDVVKPTKVKGIRIVTNGDPLRSFGDVAAAGRQLITEARALADIVIIDTAPLLATNDAVELIPAVDSVVLVCRSGQTTSDAAKRSRELIARLSAPVAGVVLVGAPPEGRAYGDYYSDASMPAASSAGSRPDEISFEREPAPEVEVPDSDGADRPYEDEPTLGAPLPAPGREPEPLPLWPEAPPAAVEPDQRVAAAEAEGRALEAERPAAADVTPAPVVDAEQRPATDTSQETSLGTAAYERLTGRSQSRWEEPLDWDELDWDELEARTAPDPPDDGSDGPHEGGTERSEHRGHPA